MNEKDEKLDIVNINDQVVGTIIRGEIKSLFTTTGTYVRYANCFIQNSEGKLWIPTRAAHKKIAPNGLDFSASEHVQSGESYETAALRGLREELNLAVSPSKLKLMGKLTPAQNRPYFSAIYIVNANEPPQYNTDDFISFKWLSVSELRTQLTKGMIAKSDLKPALALLKK